jgi:hypothetical protein
MWRQIYPFAAKLKKALSLANFQLAQTFHTSSTPVSKRKNRETCEDKSSRPHQIAYALNEPEESLVGFIRKTTRLPLDEVWEMPFVYNPQIARSSVYRTFCRNHVNRVQPAGKGKKPKSLKNMNRAVFTWM